MLLNQPSFRDDSQWPLDVYPFEGALVKLTANEAIASGTTVTTVPWDAEVFDTDAFWSSGSPTRLTCAEAVAKIKAA